MYRFIKDGKPIYVGWYDCFDELKCSAMKIDTRIVLSFDNDIKQARITEAVPKYETGKEATDHATALNAETRTTNNGMLTIGLKDIPVFVEGIK